MTDLVNKLSANNSLSKEEFSELLKFRNNETTEYLFEKALLVKEKFYGKSIYLRGIVELTNYCKNNCYYCGLRRDNIFISRYRLDEKDLLGFCEAGYDRGVRSFMLVGGDDYNFTEAKVADFITMLKDKFSDCQIGLSLGQRSEKTYRKWFEAGAVRYELSHETAAENHFKKLHPPEMSLLTRKQSLWELKSIGYQVGTGFMVGSPYQMVADVVEDLLFLKQLDPQIVHIVPFMPTIHTRFEHERSGNGDMTLYLMAIARLMLPRAMITADTILDDVMQDGRKKSLEAGAGEINVELCTDDIKEYYNVYNKKIHLKNFTGDDVERIKKKVVDSGFEIGQDKGDYIPVPEEELLYGRIHRLMRPQF